MTIKTARDLGGLLAVGQVVRSTIAAMEAAIRPGVTTAELGGDRCRAVRAAGAPTAL